MVTALLIITFRKLKVSKEALIEAFTRGLTEVVFVFALGTIIVAELLLLSLVQDLLCLDVLILLIL